MVGELHKEAGAQYARNPQAFGNHLLFSWDNARAHTSAEPDMDLLPEQVVHPPPKSPDLQRAVEVPHALIKREFSKRFTRDTRINDMAAAIKLLRRVQWVPKSFLPHLCLHGFSAPVAFNPAFDFPEAGRNGASFHA